MEGPCRGHVEEGDDHVGGGVQSPLLRRARRGQCQPQVRASKAPFMEASGRGRRNVLVRKWRSSEFVIWMNVLLRGWKEESAGNVVDAMAERGHSAQDCRCVGRFLGRSQGRRGACALAWTGRTREKLGSDRRI